MDKQEIFEKVATHLFTQGERAMGIEVCQYRADNGRMCAVGCLIPDELYNPRMEENDAITIIGNFPLPNYFKKNKMLLDALQSVHDHAPNWYNTIAMRNRLEAIGGDFNLNTKFLTELSFKDR